MPELPAPPSSSDEDDDMGATPVNARVSLLADFTAAKTPRPPGAWAATPVPAQVDKPVVAAPLLPPEAQTPVPAPVNLTANNTLSAIPTPAPPGAWQLTPGSSMRRKSILKVRFDFDANSSGESMPEVPIIGPSDPADSISEVFPALMPPVASTSQAVVKRPVSSPLDERERSSTPPTVRVARTRPKSPGLRLMDAFGREAPEGPSAPSTASSVKSDPGVVVPAPAPPTLPADATPRSKSLVRIVDAMGREVDSEQSMDESSSSLPPPTSRGEALSRIRETLSKMADDLGESDDSRTVAAREDQRLRELHRASQAARSARREIAESLQKQRGDPSSSSAKGKLLAPVIRNSRFSIDFSNAWMLWCFILLQVVLSIYMYRLSTIRAKQIFLTTYYDAFTPDLFSHLSKTQSVQHAIPPASSPTPSPFSITDALTRDGWKAVLAEAWARSTVVITELQNHIWDVWGRHPGRSHAWPPT
ncbi:hypothetical protein PHLGIDRAFT_187040 [Phlebiopsis gigantea 11061_1 CR5-6]|uniref:Uncharacterized protein n=1 Tax=Phlebiopsis gigantea (strain 11061_1 CR5-6) TaxID=745531 RepID=A0A0C3SEU7_PHLG1|nr:hypothetical protein PHLGIDRAFT_187040 [Phlebiopsis gigantea 11061_1 CR5-6]